MTSAEDDEAEWRAAERAQALLDAQRESEAAMEQLRQLQVAGDLPPTPSEGVDGDAMEQLRQLQAAGDLPPTPSEDVVTEPETPLDPAQNETP